MIKFIARPGFFERPLALEPGYARRLFEADYEAEQPQQRDANLYKTYPGGVAVIPCRGVMVHAESWMSAYVGEIGYDRIGGSFSAALSDSDVRAIVLHIESPGGDVDGCFELCDKIYEARGAKPICAICDPYAYSAAYALASACDQISVPESGGVGSIGVITMHADMSDALKQVGIDMTIVQYGDQKAERGPFGPLSPGARQRMQDDVDALGEMFVGRVARNRGISKKSIKETQAGLFMGSAAIDAGLADAVMSPQQAFSTLMNNLKRKK